MIVCLVGVGNPANALMVNYASVVLNKMLSNRTYTACHGSTTLSRQFYEHHCFDMTYADSSHSCRMYLLSLPTRKDNLGEIVLPESVRLNNGICWENNLRHRVALALIQGMNADTQLDYNDVMYFESFASDCVWTRVACVASKQCANSYSRNGVFNIEFNDIYSRDLFAVTRNYPHISLSQSDAVLAVRIRGSKGYWLTVDVRTDGKLERSCDHCELTTEWQIIEMNIKGEVLEEIKFNVGVLEDHNEEIVPLIAKYQSGIVAQIDWFAVGGE